MRGTGRKVLLVLEFHRFQDRALLNALGDGLLLYLVILIGVYTEESVKNRP